MISRCVFLRFRRSYASEVFVTVDVKVDVLVVEVTTVGIVLRLR